jgi:hypothetical protein
VHHHLAACITNREAYICQVVRELIREAYLLQTSPQAAEASFTPAKHPLLVGADTVPRAKRRKQCKNDAVARVDPDALFAAATE